MIDRFQGAYSFLSNFYLCDVFSESILYHSIEHAYQAAKTVIPEEKARVRDARMPAMAKRIGGRVLLRPNWDRVKLTIMQTLLQSKFRDPTLRAKLLDTSDEELVEGNWWGDTYWGVYHGVGENHLGRLLMELRGDIQRGNIAGVEKDEVRRIQ